MNQPIIAALAALLCLAGGATLAQTASPDSSMAPGADASPSVAANRGRVPRGHSHAHRAHAHTAPGKAAAPSVADNQGDTGAPSVSTTKPGAGQGAAGAGSAASVSHEQNGTPQPH
jgi:hypothetical protein